MDLTLNRRRKHTVVISDDLKDLYPHDISLYRNGPSNEMFFTEFEDLALDRLKLLRIIDNATLKGLKHFSTEWKGFIIEQAQKENLKKFVRLLKSKGTTNPTDLDYQARRADVMSHLILRMAYCRSKQLQQWFIARELELFKMRFTEMSQQSMIQFLQLYNFAYKPISEDEKMSLREDLIDSTMGYFNFDTTHFYKINFLEVLNLVKRRSIFIKAGYAYVPSFEMVSCISNLFRVELNECLAYACKNLPSLDDDRINTTLSNINNAYTGDNYAEKTNTTGINLAHLNLYAKSHYPLCMKHLHDLLKRNNHLKHGSRLQYLLFLKGIGLKFEDTMTFWRDEFTKKMDGNIFEKQYAYLVKHSYGLVGGGTNYSPHSCISIINYSVGSGDMHGCPFKHWDVTNLKRTLEEFGISEKGVLEISEKAKQGHYQIACAKYYEHMHGGQASNVVINHPNQYFENSFNLGKDKDGNKISSNIFKIEPMDPSSTQ